MENDIDDRFVIYNWGKFSNLFWIYTHRNGDNRNRNLGALGVWGFRVRVCLSGNDRCRR